MTKPRSSEIPKNVKVVTEKGTKRVSKNVGCSGKNFVTVLASGTTNGKKMPLFIIFSGVYVWTTWVSRDDIQATYFSFLARTILVMHTNLFQLYITTFSTTTEL